jgi:hypothetical protein
LTKNSRFAIIWHKELKMYRVDNSLLFRNIQALDKYLQDNPGKTFVIEYITSYTLGDPMEQ